MKRGGDSGTGFTTSAEGSGNSGDLIVNTSSLTIQDTNGGITTLPFLGAGENITVNGQ